METFLNGMILCIDEMEVLVYTIHAIMQVRNTYHSIYIWSHLKISNLAPLCLFV